VKRGVLFIVLVSLGCFLPAQGRTAPAGTGENIDWIFEGGGETGEDPDGKDDILGGTVKQSRVTLAAEYNFFGGFSPGWTEPPWYSDGKFNYILGAKMEALLSLDFQITEHLRVWNAFYFSIPDSSVFSIKEFYFDYDISSVFFLRAGQYEINWGISTNYPYTNLPARIPAESARGNSYIAKADLPIGIGGLQFLIMTRQGFMEDQASPKIDEFAYGAKYNLALQRADIDMGFFYFWNMPMRFFTSLKTTIGDTELYAEALAAAPYKAPEELSFSGSAGFLRDFFGSKITLNGEIFYNGEKGLMWYWRAKADIRDAEASPFIEGWNAAANVIIRPGVLGMRIFCRCLYALDANSVQLAPGISLKPGNLLTFSLTVPMVLGSRESGYYRHNMDTENRPFSIVLAASLSGSFNHKFILDN
jgi:hypothetical protein